ncbi:MAG TPA: helix-turn-helix transcriptional regulator [Candidatus Dormibacteraeota bacterium]|nr:helix-turn-helix transcriptional regulator [Candidatus Dormibacteraeota bacterium]
MPDDETLGQRIRRVRQERGMSLAKVSREDFSRAFLHQVEHGRSQPSTRVLRVIAGRLGTEVDYLLEGRLPGVERELALEKGRVLLARGDARKALAALQPAADSTEWPLGADARLSQAEALLALEREPEAGEILAREKEIITSHRDRQRLQRLRAIEKGERLGYGNGGTKGALESAVKAHLKLADQAQRNANSQDALEHYRAARVLLEVR